MMMMMMMMTTEAKATEVARIPAGSTLLSLLIEARTYTPSYNYAPFGVSGLVPFSHCAWLKSRYHFSRLSQLLKQLYNRFDSEYPLSARAADNGGYNDSQMQGFYPWLSNEPRSE
ncbi:hypothetical protein EVAR_95144_1 [Eumeta japonica]|uniref:Uncharacterized protein n=1 Tax=Eumeta variegata TaxID=151549 RepID=A0A4C1W8F4_EUMVA|nr:hypothetical protein EVAR_95144_1 [Eumeta japonica]